MCEGGAPGRSLYLNPKFTKTPFLVRIPVPWAHNSLTFGEQDGVSGGLYDLVILIRILVDGSSDINQSSSGRS